MDDKTGEFRYESRSVDETVSLELLNCTEKDRYMIVCCAPCGTYLPGGTYFNDFVRIRINNSAQNSG